MAVDLLLDRQTGDILLENSTPVLTTTIEDTTRQQVLITLGCFRGEWIYNLEFGVPYIRNDNNSEQLLGAATDTSLLDIAIQEAVLSVERIVGINAYQSTWDKITRSVLVSFVAETESGELLRFEDQSIT